MSRRLTVVIAVLGVVIALASTACRHVADRSTAATVRHVNIEGGCWMLQVESERLEPLNLAAEFQKDGLSVRVEFEEVRGVRSVCQMGKLVRILKIRGSQ